MELDAKKSLCWTCKYGICIGESDILRVMDEDAEAETNIFATQDEQKINIPLHEMEQKAVKAVCYWRPDHLITLPSPPVLMSNVHQCNRHDNS